MTVTYLDPYKDNPYGKLKGDKKDTYFKAMFDECKFYKHENAYYLAGQFTLFAGIDRAFGNDPINPVLCELPIYGSQYEVRQKVEGTGLNGTKKEYETIKVEPSIAEQLLYQHLEDNPSKYFVDGKAFKGDLTFYPDDNYAAMSDIDAKMAHLLKQVHLEQIDWTGNYPNWTPPKTYRSNGSFGNKGASLEDKLTFLKTELSETVNDHTIRTNKELPIAAYLHKIIDENENNERFLVCYLDLVKALIS